MKTVNGIDIANYKYMDPLFLDEYKAFDAIDLIRETPLRVETVEGGIILASTTRVARKHGGVLTSKKQFVEISAFKALIEVDRCDGYEPSGEIPYFDDDVIYIGTYWKHWGHFIMDCVVRLWYVFHSSDKLKLVYSSHEEIDGVYLEFFELLGIEKERLIRLDKTASYRTVVVPECANVPGVYIHEEFHEMFRLIICNALKAESGSSRFKNKKVYFTRRQLNRIIPMEIGERSIEKFFRINGYEIVAPEKLSLREQIILLQNVEEIACLSGTLAHNMIFAKEGAKLTVIRKTNKPNYRQTSVNQIKRLKVINIDAHISLKAVGPAGPFVLDLNKNLRQYAKDYNYKIPENMLLSWFLRKIRFVIYELLYLKRNRGKNYKVPLFIHGKFDTVSSAEDQLYNFYRKRI